MKQQQQIKNVNEPRNVDDKYYTLFKTIYFNDAIKKNNKVYFRN